MNKRNLIRNGKQVDNEMNGEDIVPFLEEALAEEKEQSIMCQHFFNIWLNQLWTFDASVCRHQEFFSGLYFVYRRTRMSI